MMKPWPAWPRNDHRWDDLCAKCVQELRAWLHDPVAVKRSRCKMNIWKVIPVEGPGPPSWGWVPRYPGRTVYLASKVYK